MRGSVYVRRETTFPYYYSGEGKGKDDYVRGSACNMTREAKNRSQGGVQKRKKGIPKGKGVNIDN